MSPELRQLRYFVAVAEERHFGRAAIRLRIAQPGLSQQIKRLEETIGSPLLIRDKRRVEVTPAGEAFLEYARLAIQIADRAVEEARMVAEGHTAVIKLGAYAVGFYPALAPLIERFKELNPRVHIAIHPGHVEHTLGALARREVDIVVTFAPFSAPDDARYHRLGFVEPLVVLPADHPLASLDRFPRSALLKETFFEFPRDRNPTLIDHMRTVFFGTTDHPSIREVVDATELLLHVGDGEGIAVSHPSAALLESPRVKFVRLEDPPPMIEYGVVWYEANTSPFARSFLELAQSVDVERADLVTGH